MKKDELRAQRAKRFTHIWIDSRTDAKKTQAFMAEGLGVSKKTIQNWEGGVCAPDMFSGSEWFRLLELNPLPYYLTYLFPYLVNGDSADEEDAEVDEALMMLIKSATPEEKRQLLYLMAGRHGSMWYPLLQMFTAYCHTSMKSRVNAARLILENYEMDEQTGKLVCPDSIKPNLNILTRAVEHGKKVVLKNSEGYSNIVIPIEIDDDKKD